MGISNYFISLVLTLGLFLPLGIVSAQNADPKTITGRITDAKTQLPLEGATVETLPPGSSALTDSLGQYELEISNDATQIVVAYSGISDTVAVTSSGTQHIRLTLDQMMAEVLIEKRRKSTEINMLGTAKMEMLGPKELAKAACCNLSESFETTPSIDVGFTDAVSGFKQVSMLGLAGYNTLFTRENVPDIRGLAATTGLSFTPGTWVESIQLSKGSGSVVNGFEGAAGQINIEWLKPFEDKTSQWLFNGYQSTQGRTEGNIVYNTKINEALSTTVLLHGRGEWARVDQNHDGFLDQPLGKSFIGSNRWFYFSPKGLEIQGGLKGIYLDNFGGQHHYNKGDAGQPGKQAWGYETAIKRAEGWAKIGKVFADHPGRSMGLQLAGTYHDQQSQYGLRGYKGKQQSFYANYIYQDIIGNTNHTIRAGASLQTDQYEEHFQNDHFARTEVVPGVFAEYGYNHLAKFNITAGLRADYHNIFGAFVTPRLHIRYAPAENSVFRASVGRAQRTSNILADNAGLMASGRTFVYPANYTNSKLPYGLEPEIAWNMGINFTHKFMLNYRDGAFSIDYYYTHFQNQAVVDLETPGYVYFYNLDGKSMAHSFQAQLDYEPIRKFDMRLAYRFYDVNTTYQGMLKTKPLIAVHRAFANLAYEFKHGFKADYTVQWIGAKRLPMRYYDGNVLQNESFSDPFVTMNAQISKSFANEAFELYAGGENLTGFMQHHMILGLDDPYGPYFDASMVWGPGMGRNVYLGFRYKIK